MRMKSSFSLLAAMICLLPIVVLCFFSSCTSQHTNERNVAATSQWLFAFDADGKVLWKKPSNGMSIAAWSSERFLALNDTAHLVSLRNSANGAELWHRSFQGNFASWGFDSDTAGHKQVIKLTVESDSVREQYVLDAETGSVIQHDSQKRELPLTSPSGGICAPRSVQEEVVMSTSSRYIVAYNVDTELRWKAARAEDEHVSSPANEVLAISTNRVRALDKFTGKELWSRVYPIGIKSTASGQGAVKIVLQDNTSQVLDIRTGEPYKPAAE